MEPVDVLHDKRMILLSGSIELSSADDVIARMLAYEAQSSSADIFLLINSTGGSVGAGLAIYDVMQLLTCDVVTIGMGKAESIAAVLLAAGAKGKRLAMPQLQVLVHQPSESDVSGSTTDLRIEADHMEDVRCRIFSILAEKTGKSYEAIRADAERDRWFDAQGAVEYGLVDSIVTSRDQLP